MTTLPLQKILPLVIFTALLFSLVPYTAIEASAIMPAGKNAATGSLISDWSLAKLIAGRSNLARSSAAVPLRPAAPVSSVTPVTLAGNSSCTALGFQAGYKIEPVNGGTYTITGSSYQIVLTVNGSLFNWTASAAVIDAVLVKGGPNTNLYRYNPPAPSAGDNGLHSPINPSNGAPHGLSHLEFCYTPAVTVSKTANPTFKRTYDWDIDKSAIPTVLNIFNGDTGTVEYEIELTKGAGVDSDWAVSGNITIANNSGFTAVITSVSDSISGGVNPIVSCGAPFPIVLANSQSLICTYSTGLPDGSPRTNTATVTTTGSVAGGTATAPIQFTTPTTVVNDSVNVNDTYDSGDRGPISSSTSYTYSRTFACGRDSGRHDNTATIVETGDSASESVFVNCHALSVAKTVNTGFRRNWNWDIDKTGPSTVTPVAPSQTVRVDYDVTVAGTYVDSLFAASGGIAVTNPAPVPATINSVSDVISPNIMASVNCSGVSFPHTLAANSTLNCTYSATLPDAAARTNTATAVQQNYSYSSQGVRTAIGTTNYTDTEPVNFANATVSIIDECVTVVDDKFGPVGQFCAVAGSQTFTFEFYRDFAFPACGDYPDTNIATLTTNDTGATDSDSHTVIIRIPCGVCVRTPGYWKTHAKSLFASGPPYDDTWNLYKNAPVTGVHNDFDPFYISGANYIEVLWTSPAGNAYYNLSFHYIAAQLNIEAGSDPSLITAQMARAAFLFSTYTPADIGALKGKHPLRQEMITIAGVLGSYNEGTLGPVHCNTTFTPQ